MSEEQVTLRREFDRVFCFESYGVTVRIESDDQELLEKAEAAVRKDLLNRIRIIDNLESKPDHSYGFSFNKERELFLLFKDGLEFTDGAFESSFFKFFGSVLRIEVAEGAVGKVFIHAGVVGWKGRAVVIPANSFRGKTTLVAELVKNGAEYYSDEYAIVDERGLIHSFPRMLSIRSDDGQREDEITVESFGGKIGNDPLPAGLIIITEFEAGAEWNPEILTLGQGIIEIIPHTIPRIFNPEFSLKVLKTMASRAIIAKGSRGEAKTFAKTILSFFDNFTI